MKTLSTQQIDQILAEKSNDELLAMLAQPDDWQSDLLGVSVKTQAGHPPAQKGTPG
jgi:hypothetical protein